MDQATRVVRVGCLEEFTAEVDLKVIRNFGIASSMIRLSLADRWLRTGIPTKSVQLHLQGINNEGEIVWLMESHDVACTHDGEPWSPRDRSVLAGMLAAIDIVRDHLSRRGYDVRPGTYALPKNVEPVRGRFECLKWRKNADDTYTVIALDQEKETNHASDTRD